MSVYRHPLVVRYGQFCFRYRGTLFPAALVLLCAVFWPARIFADRSLDHAADLVLFALILSGEGIRAATIGLQYIIRGGRGKRPYAEDLVTSGMFAHLRNPLYVGNFLLIAGLLALTGRIETVAIGLAFIVVCYVAMVGSEEAFLRTKFGAEYEAYCARVPRWIPDLRGVSETFRGASFDWRRVLLADFGTIYGWVSIGAGVLAAKTAIRWSGPGDAPVIAALAGVWLAASAVYLAVRRARRAETRPGARD